MKRKQKDPLLMWVPAKLTKKMVSAFDPPPLCGIG